MSSTWLDIPEDSEFSLQNIPFGVCSFPGSKKHRCVTAIGDKVVDLQTLQDAAIFDDIQGINANVFSNSTLNAYMEHSPDVWPQVRQRLQDVFSGKNAALASDEALQRAAMHDRTTVQMHLPARIGDYTDFYSSREHATNVGTMFRGKDNALQPNWLHLPVGYHGRSSTVVVSGHNIVRPHGQLQIDPQDPKKGSKYGPCRLLDFELEMAFFVGGPPNEMGRPLSMEEAKRRIFGFCLMNDWSARDIQKWEYVPLGPFTAKNFATTISPWIVSTEALEPFVAPTSAGTQHEPVPLEYLQDPNYSSYDVALTVAIQSPTMKSPHVVCNSNFANLYWNAAQQLVHHSVTGCTMNPGDLLASGTISGQSDNAFGSMLELSWKGSREVELGEGETRKFLKDGDKVIMKGFCSKAGVGRVGFGECLGTVLPAGTVIAPDPKPVARFTNFKLYAYWRSSSSWRVRIALAAKGTPYEVVPVNLLRGEHKSESIFAMNPMGQIPVLQFTDIATGETRYMTQSIAMIEFLDQCFPQSRSLIPQDITTKAVAMEMVEVINSGIQPLQNVPMVNGLERASEGKIVAKEFARDAIVRGLKVLETLINRYKREPFHQGPFSLGTFCPSIVDACLIPQLYNARRFGVDVDNDFPCLGEIDTKCSTHPWFVAAHASVQIDAEDL